MPGSKARHHQEIARAHVKADTSLGKAMKMLKLVRLHDCEDQRPIKLQLLQRREAEAHLTANAPMTKAIMSR